MRSARMLLAAGVASVLIANHCVTPAAPAGEILKDLRAKITKHYQGPSVEILASELDQLEAHIDKHGSIVPKQPDVWGQARLTKHRHEFEREMAKQLDQFKPTINASISRSDQAFLASALSLQAAITGRPAVLEPAETATHTRQEKKTQGEGSDGQAGASEKPESIRPPEGPKPESLISGFETITRTELRQHKPRGFGKVGEEGIQLEPTIFLDQMSRYLNHLNELRRINEGDDTADSPGYSLNLARIPVSILPGKKTRDGYGAEITITATPYLSDELLPTTFRSLVINDLVDQLAPGFALLFNSRRKDADRVLTVAQQIIDGRAKIEEPLIDPYRRGGDPAPRRALELLILKFERDVLLSVLQSRSQDSEQWLQDRLNDARTQITRQYPGYATDGPTQQALLEIGKWTKRLAQEWSQFVDAYGESGGAVALPSSRTRRARLPLPLSHKSEMFGPDQLGYIAVYLYKGFQHDPQRADYVHPQDIESFFQEELQAAYDFLSAGENAKLWSHCTSQLAEAVRGHRDTEIRELRERFLEQVEYDAQDIPTSALAWAILVESALLNQQLIEDMRVAAANKRCPSPGEAWCEYYGPNPSQQAREAFNRYVECRWPIHVFAIDPVTQDQNVADSLSRRRELQLALALSFASGQMSAQNLTRFARRLETDVETLALNRTAVGFSHGGDTFGWRFYPRVQTPPTEGNATVLFRDLLLGGPTREQDLKKRQLEPGVRECVAIVVMPSFVPYVTFDVRTNWFRLTNPKCKELSLTDTMKLSKTIQSMHSYSASIQDGCKYRDGELERLLRRVHQLDVRLPLQTMRVQVPYENTLGGFEMFATGITDLAPELAGYYGEPGIRVDPSNELSTDLFLVGDHFSVHETEVIVGGKKVSSELISRQVMHVCIPSSIETSRDAKWVDVHVATPYGVSNHLFIPAVQPRPAAKEERKPAKPAVERKECKKPEAPVAPKPSAAEPASKPESKTEPAPKPEQKTQPAPKPEGKTDP